MVNSVLKSWNNVSCLRVKNNTRLEVAFRIFVSLSSPLGLIHRHLALQDSNTSRCWPCTSTHSSSTTTFTTSKILTPFFFLINDECTDKGGQGPKSFHGRIPWAMGHGILAFKPELISIPTLNNEKVE